MEKFAKTSEKLDNSLTKSSDKLDKKFDTFFRTDCWPDRPPKLLQTSLRQQLKSLENRKLSSQIARQLDSLEAKLAALEGDEGGYGTSFLSTPEGRSLARLNTGFNVLVSGLDSADAAPTTQQTAMFSDLEKALNEQLSAWDQLKSKDVPELSKQLKKAGAPELN